VKEMAHEMEKEKQEELDWRMAMGLDFAMAVSA